MADAVFGDQRLLCGLFIDVQEVPQMTIPYMIKIRLNAGFCIFLQLMAGIL